MKTDEPSAPSPLAPGWYVAKGGERQHYFRKRGLVGAYPVCKEGTIALVRGLTSAHLPRCHRCQRLLAH